MKDRTLQFVQNTVNNLRSDKKRLERGINISEGYSETISDRYARTVESLTIWEEILKACKAHAEN